MCYITRAAGRFEVDDVVVGRRISFGPSIRAAVVAILCAAATGTVDGSITDSNGFEWVRITHPGNIGYDGPNTSPPYDVPRTGNRGRVNYVYSISKFEVTSKQWAEFINTFYARPDYYNFTQTIFGRWSFLTEQPTSWGGKLDLTYTGPGSRYTTNLGGVDTSMLPVFGISWRDAAMYCNWLHNNKRTDMAALLTGAYDTSTWDSDGYIPYTDSWTHLPGAKYWIPTLDEWMKATYYDPNRYGLNQGGWWQYMNRRDTVPIVGYPSDPGATTNGQLWGYLPGSPADPRLIPLGAYEANGGVSPWGLLDTASGASEWVEEVMRWRFDQTDVAERGLMGPTAGNKGPAWQTTHTSNLSASEPTLRFGSSIRLASSVPAPSSSMVLLALGGAGLLSGRRRRCSMASSL